MHAYVRARVLSNHIPISLQGALKRQSRVPSSETAADASEMLVIARVIGDAASRRRRRRPRRRPRRPFDVSRF